MGHECVSCCSFVLLLFVTIAHGDGVNVLRLHSMDSVDQQKQQQEEAKPSGHMGMAAMAAAGETSPWDMTVTLLKGIEVGKTRPIYYPHVGYPSSLEFLPKEKTQNIPLSTKALPELLRFLSVSPDSVQAMVIKKALQHCELIPEIGEIHHCATSSESLADFVHRVHGSREFRILRTSQISKSTPTIQNYTVIENKEVANGKIIVCHYQGYRYAPYYCHVDTNSMNKVLMVSLIGDNGQRVTGPFICHMNTSSWKKSNFAFRVLGVKAGESEVCHSLPAHDMVVIPK